MRYSSIVLGIVLAGLVICSPVHAAVETANIDLIYEFDGNSLTTNFGTIVLQDNELLDGVDVTITANTANLLGGDIHEWYFNLPDKFGSLIARDFTLSDFGGVSNKGIGSFTMLRSDPSIAGGAGALFEWGVNFGNGGGKNGNGQLTTATFNIDAAVGLEVQDFLDAELSYPNNTPPVLEAVHFQGTGVFGATSETVGGPPLHISTNPEPSSVVIWLAMGGICAGVATYRSRKRRG